MPDNRGRPTELEIQHAMEEYLRWTGWFVVPMNQQWALSYPGIADLYALKNSISVWFEVKKPKGKQSDNQKIFEADIKAKKGNYFVVVTIEDVEEATRGLRWK